MNTSQTVTVKEHPNYPQHPKDTTGSSGSFLALATRLNHSIYLLKQYFFKDEEMPELNISFERLQVNSLGEYRVSPTGFGSCHQVIINRKYLDIPFHQLLAVILHQLTHCWEETNFRTTIAVQQPWYHTIRFRQKMLSFGIMSDQHGTDHGFGPDCAFAEFLRKQAVFPSHHKQQFIPLGTPNKPGLSKHKKWSCNCTNIRVAVPIFQALCLKCNQQFHKEQF